MVLAVWGYLSSAATVRKSGLQFIGFLVLLGFFGVVLDIVVRISVLEMHAKMVAHVEDGGELMVISLMLAFVTSLLWRSWQPKAVREPHTGGDLPL